MSLLSFLSNGWRSGKLKQNFLFSLIVKDIENNKMAKQKRFDLCLIGEATCILDDILLKKEFVFRQHLKTITDSQYAEGVRAACLLLLKTFIEKNELSQLGKEFPNRLKRHVYGALKTKQNFYSIADLIIDEKWHHTLWGMKAYELLSLALLPEEHGLLQTIRRSFPSAISLYATISNHFNKFNSSLSDDIFINFFEEDSSENAVQDKEKDPDPPKNLYDQLEEVQPEEGQEKEAYIVFHPKKEK